MATQTIMLTSESVLYSCQTNCCLKKCFLYFLNQCQLVNIKESLETCEDFLCTRKQSLTTERAAKVRSFMTFFNFWQYLVLLISIREHKSDICSLGNVPDYFFKASFEASVQFRLQKTSWGLDTDILPWGELSLFTTHCLPS